MLVLNNGAGTNHTAETAALPHGSLHVLRNGATEAVLIGCAHAAKRGANRRAQHLRLQDTCPSRASELGAKLWRILLNALHQAMSDAVGVFYTEIPAQKMPCNGGT